MLKNKGLSSASSSDCTSTDVYRMCKKIAQLTKVIYNLNVKNDELEVHQTRMQHDYEKKIWKLSADVQQHAANAASMLRSESAQSAELSQVRVHLEEQMSRADRLVDELAQTNQQHTVELETMSEDHQRQLEELRQQLTAESSGRRAELERTRRRLEETASELTVVRVERARAQERTVTLESAAQAARAEAELARAEELEQRQRAEEWRTATVSGKQLEVQLRRELSALASSHDQELERLSGQLAKHQQQLAEHASELADGRGREEQLLGRVQTLVAERDRLAADLVLAGDQLLERDRDLGERDQRLQQQQKAIQEQETRRLKLVDQLRTKEQELVKCKALQEGAEHQARQRTAELSRAAEQQQRLQADCAAAKTRGDQLSQLLIQKDSEISQLEVRAAESAASAAAAAAPSPAPPSDDAGEVTRLRAELETAREQRTEAEREREEQSNLLQSALEESAAMEASLRGRLERLQTVTSQTEQQVMDDAEQRLREVQRDCRRRLDEQQAAAEERVKAAREVVEAELQAHIKALAEQDAVVSQKMQEAEQQRALQAEVVQLRGLTHELMRELRVGTRQLESARTQEARCSEENRRLTERLTRLTATAAQKERVSPEQLQQLRLQWEERALRQREQALAALSAEWEDRLREQCSGLKAELDSLHAEEKQLAVEAQRLNGEQQRRDAEQHVRQLQQQLAEAETVRRHQQAESERQQAELQAELERQQAEAEARFSDLRRQLLELVRQKECAGGAEAAPDDEEGGGDAGDIPGRQHGQIDVLLRHRPDLRAALDEMLAEKEAETVAVQEELKMARGQRESEQQEHRTEVAALREQVAARDRLADQLLNDLGETRRDLTQSTEQAATELKESKSQVQAVLASSRRQVQSVELKTQRQLERMRAESQSAAQLAQQRIQELESLAAAAREQPRPQDRDAIQQLESALEARDRQLSQAQRERRQLALELSNRDASYSRLFAAAPPRVGVLDPTARPATPSRPQRRPHAGRGTKR